MTQPRVSVCVGTYNQERYISDCLLSIMAQQFDVELEVLVGDDGSTDNTPEVVQTIAEHYPGIIKLFRHEKNLGPAGNYQYLIERASGNFIAHLDGDDYWLPGKLQAQLAFLQDHPECVAVYSNAAVVSDTQELLGAFNNGLPQVFDRGFLLQKGNFLNHSSLLYRAHLKGEILAITGRFIDYQMHLRFSRHGMLGFLNQAFVVYRAGSVTSMVKNVPDVVRQLYWKALAEVQPGSVRPSALLGAVANFWYPICYVSLRHGDFATGYHWARRIQKESPVSPGRALFWGTLKGISEPVRGIINRVRNRLCDGGLSIFYKR